MINELSKEIYKRNIQKGFYEEEKNIAEMLCLIHSEVSEALECDRKEKHCKSLSCSDFIVDKMFKTDFEIEVKDTFEDELADIMIRVMDLAGYLNIDLEAHIQAKMRYNLLRPYKHGKKY